MFTISGFYKFNRLKSLKKNKNILLKLFINKNIKGTLIVSPEGLNGTISGKKRDLTTVKNKIKKLFRFSKFDSENFSNNKFQPFHKPKVKLKKEVVPMGIDILRKKHKNYVHPKNWNGLIKDNKTLVLDARKPFEYKVGSFKTAINPNVTHFRDFPKYLNKLNKSKPVAMFCTGGIRCEKASAFLEQKGFRNVFQLKGGILNYLKVIKKQKSLWKGECFVFDNRVSVKHNLKVGTFFICSGCRTPISSKVKKSKKYEEGVSCPNCYDKLTHSQKKRFRMRQKQINLAKTDGKKHIFQKEF